MAMFDDPKKELKKLEEQLLKEEDWLDRELAAARALIGDAPAKKPQKAAPKRTMEQTQVYRKSGSGTQTSRSGSAPVRNFANDYGSDAGTVVRNTESADRERSKKKAGAKKDESIKGLVILAGLETLGIVGVVAYWLLFLL